MGTESSAQQPLLPDPLPQLPLSQPQPLPLGLTFDDIWIPVMVPSVHLTPTLLTTLTATAWPRPPPHWT